MSKFGIVNQNTGNKTQFFTDFVRKKKNHAPDRSGIPRHDSYRDGDTADSGLRRQKINNNSILLDYQLYYDAQQPPAYNGEQVSAGQNYNGNINGIAVNYHFAAQSGLTNFNEPTIYGYTYDQLNRLVQADGLVGDFVAASGGQTQQSYLIGDESYSFDRIGNLKTLQRYLRNTAGGQAGSLEGFTYNYQAGSNRLTGVNAQAGGTDRAYSYDANGNALTDSYKNISQTDYGRAAYAYRQVVDGSELLYLYDVGDARIYKSSTKNGITKQEYYLKDAGGKDVAVYDYGTGIWNLQVHGVNLIARMNTANSTINNSNVTFFLYDHLGNTRVSYKSGNSTTPADIQYAGDYFPYGKILREFANGSIEKYLTTGHERDQETGLDYRGARYYDSDIARFLSLDTLAAKYVSWSTYNYVMSNPVMMIDPSGKGPEDPPNKMYKGAGGSNLELPANAKLLNKYLDVNEDGKISLDGGKTTLDAKDGDIWRFEVDGRAYGAKYDKNGKFNGYWDAEGNKYNQSSGQNNNEELSNEIANLSTHAIVELAGSDLTTMGIKTVLKPRMGLSGGGSAGIYTSEASVTLRSTSWANKQLPFRVLGTKTLGAGVARAVPIVGQAIIILDAVSLMYEYRNEIKQGVQARQNYIDKGLMPIR